MKNFFKTKIEGDKPSADTSKRSLWDPKEEKGAKMKYNNPEMTKRLELLKAELELS
jgi:hypothetical protein